MADLGDSFPFIEADFAPTLKIPVVDLSTASLCCSPASLSRFSIAEKIAGGRNARDPAKQEFARGDYVLSSSRDREELKSLLRTVRDDPVSNVLRPLEPTKTGRDSIGGTGVSNSVAPEPAVLILMLLGLPLVMRRRLSGSTR